MGARHTYLRPVAGWWRRNPYFVRYMAREATAFAVAAYAIVLLAGLWRLAQGRAAYEAWLDALRAPWSIALHAVLLAMFLYHTWSWFSIMPKTLPPLAVAGWRVPAGAITAAGLAASALLSLSLYLFLASLAR